MDTLIALHVFKFVVYLKVKADKKYKIYNKIIKNDIELVHGTDVNINVCCDG